MSSQGISGLNSGEGVNKPSVYELWLQAGGETPDYDRDRYIELMREHRYLLKPGDDGYEEAPKGLPCGWPNRSDDKEAGES